VPKLDLEEIAGNPAGRDIAGDNVPALDFGQGGGQEADLDLACQVHLVLETPALLGLLGEVDIADPHGRDRRQGRQQLHVLLLELAHRHPRSENDQTERSIGVEEGRSHERAHTGIEQAHRFLESLVSLGIEDQRRLPPLNHLLHEAGREQDLGVRATDRTTGRTLVSSILGSQVNRGFLGSEVFEGPVEDQLEKLVK